MGFLSKYNSSAENTNLTVNVNSGKQLHVTYQFSTGRSTFTISTNSSSNIYYITGAISNKKVIIRIAKQNYTSLVYAILNQTGSSYSSAAPSPNKIWEKNGYIYIQFSSLTLSSSQSLAIFKYDHATSSSSNSQTYYYGVNMVATIAPNWINSNPKIYDDGTQKTIPPTIASNDYYNGVSFNVTTSLMQTRFWEVSSGKTYKIRCNANTTAEAGNSSVKAYSSRDINTSTTSTAVTTTKTTDSQTGETLYTFTAPSGYKLIGFTLQGTPSATYSMESVNPRLEGKRTAGWYDVDDYGFSTAWESTGY